VNSCLSSNLLTLDDEEPDEEESNVGEEMELEDDGLKLLLHWIGHMSMHGCNMEI
jgi:hypothetical protein